MQAAKKGMLNVFYGLLGQLVTICLGIIIPRLVLVSYGSEVNGLLNSVTQIFVYFSLLEAGVGIASLQALYEPVAADNKDKIQGIMAATHRFYWKAGIAYALAVMLLSLVYPLCVKADIPYWVIAGVILFGGLGNCINFLYQGKYKILMQAEGYTYISTNITTIVNVLTSITKVILLLMGYDVLMVQFAFFVINILQMFVYMAYIKRHYSWIDLKAEPDNQAVSQKGATLVHQVSGLIFNNTDTLLLTFITQNLKIVSIYTMYNMVINMATIMIQQIETGFSFRLGQMYNTDRRQYLVLHHIFEIVYLVLVFSVMTVIYIFIVPFMRLYTAGVEDINYIGKWYSLFFVMVPLLTYGRTASNNVINYAGHFEQTKWRSILESIINIVVSVFAILKWGIYGALLGTIVASLYRTNDMILYSYKHLIKQKPWNTYKRWLVCFVIFGIVVWKINPDNPFYHSYGLILLYGCIIGICCMAIYTALLLLINPEERRNLFSILKGYMHSRNGD